MDTLPAVVAAAQAGDLEAFGSLVNRFQDMAYAVAYGIVGDAHLAEDVAQEAFIEAYLCLPKLREPAAFPGWFRRIVFKQGDRLTRGKQQASLPIETAEQLPASADVAATAEIRELQSTVRAAIAALRAGERLAVSLFYVAGYSYKDLAATLEVPLSTVKKRLYSARRRLQEQVEAIISDQLREQRPSHDSRFTRTVQFFLAVLTSNITSVKRHLDEDPALVNAHTQWDWTTARRYGLPAVGTTTSLHCAAAYSELPVVTLLLKSGANVNTWGRFGQTPLHMSVAADRRDIVECLLANKADPTIAAANGMTPLHWAVLRSSTDIVKLLLAAGAHADATDQCDRTPVEWARLKKMQEMVEIFEACVVYKENKL